MRARSYLFSCFALSVRSAPQNLALNWSPNGYGPDGPWNAITISVGGNSSYNPVNQTSVDVLPGGMWSSYIPTSQACNAESTPNPQCGRPGTTWDPVLYSDSLNVFISPTGGPSNGADGNWFTEQALSVYAKNAPDNFTVYNANLISYSNITVTNPDGSRRVPELGGFSLGGNNPAQEFDRTSIDEPSLKIEMPIAGLYNNSYIPSYSYGLHYGSASLGYGGSLVLGGYDAARMIGPISTYEHDAGVVQLRDIGIGVETGGSPFSFTNKSGILMTNQSEPGPVTVAIDPTTPYLLLPNATCHELSNYLPIEFDTKLKFWLWRTSDPAYKKIVTSASYLSFTLPPNYLTTETNPVVIKVPFILLNLTLDVGIVDTPTQYFPCLDTNNPAGPAAYSLGRAFLQAAYTGANLGENTAWIAQAPGPNIQQSGPAWTDIDDNVQYPTTTTSGHPDQRFNDTWATHWTPLPLPNKVQSGGNSNNNGTSTSGLSTDAKAGIGVGVALGALAVIGIAAFLWLRHRRKQRTARSELANTSRGDEKYVYKGGNHQTQPAELVQDPAELAGPEHAMEMPGSVMPHDPTPGYGGR
ncbi:hypothetical protein NA57DRAFT_50198 [Rhizodiscina lignyota]|uniref:Peptidase A1 domain-containing protein n=1 Tax=Rhizodiscina lignyota TaxID=1504668 RepID=A0A9P4I4B8_9PEZI|nr:hypothetical protein NA57DRAFT_50198 [Rhizodiscina lignyota]